MGTIFSLKKLQKNSNLIVPGDLSFEKNDYIEIKRKPKPPNTPYPYPENKDKEDEDIWDEYDDGIKIESSPGPGEKKPQKKVKVILKPKKVIQKKNIIKKKKSKKIIPKKNTTNVSEKINEYDELKEYDDIIECDLDELTNVDNVEIL